MAAPGAGQGSKDRASALSGRAKLDAHTAPATLPAAIEDTAVAFWRAICRRIPGASFHDDARAVWFVTGIPFFPFNQVLRFSAPADEADAAIAALLATLQTTDLPFCWNVGPASSPADLATRLAAREPARTNAMPAMALDIAAAPPPAAPPGVTIEPVRDDAGLDRWAAAYRDGFALTRRFVDAMRDVYAAVGFAGDAPFRHYVAAADGTPVACSTMFMHRGVASLWHITTLPEHRRRGIGAAMTLAPIEDARALGCRAAVLYASEMGTPLYHRLGFRQVSRLQQYGWNSDQDGGL